MSDLVYAIIALAVTVSFFFAGIGAMLIYQSRCVPTQSMPSMPTVTFKEPIKEEYINRRPALWSSSYAPTVWN